MPAPMSPSKMYRLTLPSRAGAVDILRGVDLSVNAGRGARHCRAVGLRQDHAADGHRRPRACHVAATSASPAHSLNGKGEDELAAFRRDTVGIVFQSFHLIPTMTALENVAVPLEFSGTPDAMEVARDRLERVGLGHRLTHYPGQLSGGEQQRVAIARAIASGARIILADEPTGNLDQDTGKQIMDLLFSVRDNDDVTLLLVTHDRALAARCDRIAEVRDGQIVAGAYRMNPGLWLRYRLARSPLRPAGLLDLPVLPGARHRRHRHRRLARRLHRARTDEQGQPLLGGDIEFVAHPPRGDRRRTGLHARERRGLQVATMRAMAVAGDGTALVEVKAVDAAYPLYGTLELDGWRLH